MDEPAPHQSNPHDPPSEPPESSNVALHAALNLLGQAVSLIWKVLELDSDSAEELSDEERQVLEVIASNSAGDTDSDQPGISARALTYKGTPLKDIDQRQDKRSGGYNVFSQYEKLQEYFTRAQWEVIPLYNRDGLTHAQIAVIIGKSKRAVYDRLHRALKRKKTIENQLKKDLFLITRKYTNL